MAKEQNDKRIYTMSRERPATAVLKMGIPVTIGMLFMVAYNLVDTYFIGLLHDDFQLAATNLAYPVMMVMVAIAGIVGNGGASYIARCIGANEQEQANRTLVLGLEMLIAGAVLMTGLGLLFINPIVKLLGATQNSFPYTKDYTAVMLEGSLFTMGNYAIGQLLRSEGSTFYSMVGMIAGTVANIILDPLFIFSLHMEIRGAAAATVLGNIVSVIIYLYYYLSKKTLLRISGKYIGYDGQIMREIMLVGVPHTLEQFFTTAAMIVNNNLAASYGDISVAAMGVANKIMSFGNYVYQGMAAGCQPLMGFNYGAKNYRRMKELIRAGIAETTLIELGIMAVYGIFAPGFVGMFSQSEEVIGIGAKTLRAFMLSLPFVGAVSIVRNTFNAMGKPAYAFGITVVRQMLLYIPFLLIFNYIWGYNGLILAKSVEEAICMLLAVTILNRFISHSERNRGRR